MPFMALQVMHCVTSGKSLNLVLIPRISLCNMGVTVSAGEHFQDKSTKVCKVL